MKEVKELGITHELSNCVVSRVDLDTEHHYFGIDGKDTKYFLSVTRILDLGAPFPEGLRNYLRMTTVEEQKERLEMTGGRGTKLHDANEKLLNGMELKFDDFPSSYEKEAIATFVRVMRFLRPHKHICEQIVADPALRVAGTLDLKCFVDEWKLEALLNPLKYLELDSDGDYQLKQAHLDFPYNKRIWVIIDYKYTGRNTYNHKIQVAGYKTMNNMSHKKGKALRAFTWRFSQKHKFKFDFQESKYSYNSFKRIYKTAIEYLGEFPEPPVLKVYPETIRLFDEVKS